MLGTQRKFARAYLVSDLSQAGSLTKLGPEPLADDFTLEQFKELFSNRISRIKPLLLNQRFIVGIGNIYADESLHRAKIHPLRNADTLNDSDLKRLYNSIREVLRESIENNGTSISDFVDLEGGEGDNQNNLLVYGRDGEECLCCNEEIEKTEVSGRGTHYCPNCQEK